MAHFDAGLSRFPRFLMVADTFRPSIQSDHVPEFTSAAELVRAAWTDVPTCFRSIRFGVKSLVLVSGPEGAGKSSFAIRLVDSAPGNVIYAACEEGLGPSFGGLLGRLGVKRSDFGCVGRVSLDWLFNRIDEVSCTVLAVDSIQASGLEVEDLRHLLASTALRLLVVTTQLNKVGTPCGARALQHEADVHVRVDEGHWALVKSRFQHTDGVAGAVGDGGDLDVA